jgi:hypothetical protein
VTNLTYLPCIFSTDPSNDDNSPEDGLEFRIEIRTAVLQQLALDLLHSFANPNANALLIDLDLLLLPSK